MSQRSILRKLIEAWFSSPFPNDDIAWDFDASKLLGKPCMLNVAHDTRGDKTYANVVGASPLPKGIPRPTPPDNLLHFSWKTPTRLSGKSCRTGFRTRLQTGRTAAGGKRGEQGKADAGSRRF